MSTLDLSNFEDSVIRAREEMKAMKVQLLEIIAPFDRENLESKRRVELAHIAKLILLLNDTTKIEAMIEAPDFIIARDGKRIGVEITELVVPDRVEFIRRTQNLFDDASQKYRRDCPNESLLANFWLAPNFTYKHSDKPVLIEDIVRFVHEVNSGFSGDKPDFIETFDLLPHSNLSFHFNEGAYMQEALEKDDVLKEIQKKENKIKAYIENSKTEFQWLLLVNGEVGSDSFDTFDFSGLNNLDTKFEHVFLLKDFDLEIVKIK